MPWSRHKLRDTELWAKVDATGALVTDRDGRVDVVYKPANGAKVYRAGGRNLVPLGGAPVDIEVGERAPEKTGKPGGDPTAGVPKDAIHVWTDGACTGNPGPAGLGVVIVDGDQVEEVSEFLGPGTNNIAELTAILRGLERVVERGAEQARPVVVYSDSQYSIGLLTQAWKAKANQELVATLRAVCRKFGDLRFVKVAGHAGIPLNERTDELARQAIVRRR
jgi:ribonuclease HI|nr:ribonuclease H [Kofleriaceae bacterium]